MKHYETVSDYSALRSTADAMSACDERAEEKTEDRNFFEPGEPDGGQDYETPSPETFTARGNTPGQPDGVTLPADGVMPHGSMEVTPGSGPDIGVADLGTDVQSLRAPAAPSGCVAVESRAPPTTQGCEVAADAADETGRSSQPVAPRATF